MLSRRFMSGVIISGSLVILSLAPAESSTARSATLSWSAPGDDSLTGTATAYDVRYSLVPITLLNFLTSTIVTGLPLPAAPGTLQSVTVNGLTPNVTYYFAMRTVDDRGNWSGLSNIAIRTNQTLGVGDPAQALAFSEPSPSPARAAAHFTISLPQAGLVQADAYDVTGRHVRRLVRGTQPAGRMDLAWDLKDDEGRRLAAGEYIVHARIEGTSFDRRVVVIR
jgi:hypothetical protein